MMMKKLYMLKPPRLVIELMVMTIVFGIVLRLFFFSVYMIPINSGLEPELMAGDFALAWKGFGREEMHPSRLSLIVFNDQDLQNRVAYVLAYAGERVEIRDGSLWVNEQREQILPPSFSSVHMDAVLVPTGQILWMLPSFSQKGLVEESKIEARLVFRLASYDQQNQHWRWNRSLHCLTSLTDVPSTH